jgi:hypothetical protein
MSCLESRRAAGADPGHLDADTRAHLAACPACAEYHRSLVAMDATILKALQVPLTAAAGSARTSRPKPLPRSRWLALAASIVAGVLVGSLLWVGAPRATLAREVVEHVLHEPQSLTATHADPADVERILGDAGVRLRPGIGTVTYVNSCPFRGHVVPHLVLQTAHGPVTVLMLRYESVLRAIPFEEQGYAGSLVPAGPGSVAIVGGAPADVEEVTARLLEALQWTDSRGAE